MAMPRYGSVLRTIHWTVARPNWLEAGHDQQPAHDHGPERHLGSAPALDQLEEDIDRSRHQDDVHDVDERQAPAERFRQFADRFDQGASGAGPAPAGSRLPNGSRRGRPRRSVSAPSAPPRRRRREMPPEGPRRAAPPGRGGGRGFPGPAKAGGGNRGAISSSSTQVAPPGSGTSGGGPAGARSGAGSGTGAFSSSGVSTGAGATSGSGLPFQRQLDFFRIQHFAFQQRFGDRHDLPAVLLQQLPRALVGRIHDPVHFRVNRVGGALAVVPSGK